VARNAAPAWCCCERRWRCRDCRGLGAAGQIDVLTPTFGLKPTSRSQQQHAALNASTAEVLLRTPAWPGVCAESSSAAGGAAGVTATPLGTRRASRGAGTGTLALLGMQPLPTTLHQEAMGSNCGLLNLWFEHQIVGCATTWACSAHGLFSRLLVQPTACSTDGLLFSR
jgi:hypothetical protein